MRSVCLFFFVIIIPITSFSEELLNVSINKSSAKIGSFMLVDTISPNSRAVEIEAKSGIINWQWEIPKKMINDRSICAGSVAYPMEDGSVNVLIAKYGLVNVARNKNYKVLLLDDEMDHNAHQYDGKHVVYARGFVSKDVPSVILSNINDGKNKNILEWLPSEEFNSKGPFIHKNQQCKSAKRKAEESNKDWAHVNHVERLANNNLLISMRNLSLFIEMTESGEIKYKNNSVYGVHQPTPYKSGYIAADRNCGQESIHIVSQEGPNKKIFTGEFLTIRGIDHLGSDHFLITSATSITEISLDGEIHYQAHVIGVSPKAESKVTSPRDLPKIGYCSPKTLYYATPLKFG